MFEKFDVDACIQIWKGWKDNTVGFDHNNCMSLSNFEGVMETRSMLQKISII